MLSSITILFHYISAQKIRIILFWIFLHLGSSKSVLGRKLLMPTIKCRFIYLKFSQCERIPFTQKLSQANFNPTQSWCDHIIKWNPPPPPTHHTLSHHTSNTHPPQNTQHPNKLKRQHMKLILGSQPYFDPTELNMEEDHNIF